MFTNMRRRGGPLTLAVLTILISLPGSAWAQQSGLFPLAPIRRQRPPCSQEDPVYKIYKQQYFGYHPTCWRTFPPGWGCPSREGPDRRASYAELPLGGRRPEEGFPEEEPMEQPPAMERRPPLPTVPGGERDPFQLDTPDATPRANPLPPNRNAPQPGRPSQRPAPGTEPSPFETNPPGLGDGTISPRGNRAARPATPSPNGAAPELSAPTDQPDRGVGAQTSRDDAEGSVDGTQEEGPVLALPKVNLPPADDPGVPPDPRSPGIADAGAIAVPEPGPAAPSPPPRRGLLGSLFSNLGWNWTRR